MRDGRIYRYRMALTNVKWVALDKEKGFVKGKDILGGAEHRFFWHPRESGTETLGYHR